MKTKKRTIRARLTNTVDGFFDIVFFGGRTRAYIAALETKFTKVSSDNGRLKRAYEEREFGAAERLRLNCITGLAELRNDVAYFPGKNQNSLDKYVYFTKRWQRLSSSVHGIINRYGPKIVA